VTVVSFVSAAPLVVAKVTLAPATALLLTSSASAVMVAPAEPSAGTLAELEVTLMVATSELTWLAPLLLEVTAPLLEVLPLLRLPPPQALSASAPIAAKIHPSFRIVVTIVTIVASSHEVRLSRIP
jgi:hypothetical protein